MLTHLMALIARIIKLPLISLNKFHSHEVNDLGDTPLQI